MSSSETSFVAKLFTTIT